MTRTDDVLTRLVRFITPPQPLREDEQTKLRVVVTDAILQVLVALAEERTDASGDAARAIRTVRRFAESAPAGRTTELAGGRELGAEDAALVNATLIHARLTDDAHPAVLHHPGAVVIPTALAIGQERGRGGTAFLRAVAAGYRVMAELAAPIAAQTAAAGLRNTSVFGPAAAAATAASLLDLDERRSASAILTALGASGGTLQALRMGTPEWRMQPGMAARIGIAAARLAESGEPGDPALRHGAIEGDAGFYASLVRGWSRAEDDAVVDGLMGVTHKEHATCGANQLAVEAFARLRDRHGWAPDDVVRIEIELERAGYEYPGCNSTGPFDGGGGFLSRPLAIAAVLLTATNVVTESSLAATLADPRVDDVMSRVHSRPRPNGSLGHPQRALLAVTTTDGAVYRDDGTEALDAFTLPDMRRRIDRLDEPGRSRALSVWRLLADPATCAPAAIVDAVRGR